jgi:hypothetical protein
MKFVPENNFHDPGSVRGKGSHGILCAAGSAISYEAGK